MFLVNENYASRLIEGESEGHVPLTTVESCENLPLVILCHILR